jgi:hypothetical protein
MRKFTPICQLQFHAIGFVIHLYLWVEFGNFKMKMIQCAQQGCNCKFQVVKEVVNVHSHNTIAF